MPRPQRLQDAGFVHHVISRGNDGQTIFKSPDDFKKYIELLEETRRQYPINIYNFSLVHNHIHLLVEPREDGSLSKVMQTVSKEYAKYFNRKYKRRGHVFEGRFKSFLIQEERYFFACSRYIDLNAVNTRLVTDPKEYLWSGYAHLAAGQKSPLSLDIHPLYSELGVDAKERQIAYRTLVRHQGEDLKLMDRRAGVLGDKEFKKRMKGKR